MCWVQADLSLYGATVTSWVAGGKERLFVSSKSALDGSKAVRRRRHPNRRGSADFRSEAVSPLSS